MASPHIWHVVGRRGKHRQWPVQQQRGRHLAQAGLAALPSEILTLLYRNLYLTPAAAVNLAQTCRNMALQFALHRDAILKNGIGPCIEYRVSDLRNRHWRSHAEVDVWWLRGSTMRQMYNLSAEPEAVAALWTRTFAHIRHHLQAKGHCAVLEPLWDDLYHPYLPGLRYASVTCHIQLHSNSRLHVSAQWLHDHIMRPAASALFSKLREEDCHLWIRVKLYRVCRDDLHFLYSKTFGDDDENDDGGCDMAEFESTSTYFISWDERNRPMAGHVPLSQQVLAITGAWYTGYTGRKGEVDGDKIIDDPQLDKDFCTWQSWDRDVWRYEPFSCEIAKEPRWFYM